MAEPGENNTTGDPPSHIRIEKKKPNWLPWILLGLVVLALLFALSRCGHRDNNERAAVTPPAEDTVIAETTGAQQSTALKGTSQLGAYLAGAEPTPQTFTFDQLKFDTAKSEIRPEEMADVDAVATTLAKYPSSRIRIAGYADARGSSAANVALGKARADSVKAALVAKGIHGDRIETVSGGESDPVDTNATASGQAENRRTELVIIQR